MENIKYTHAMCPRCRGVGHLVAINGKWLRGVRERANLSLREVARQLGYSPAYVSDIELGRRNANETVLAFYESLALQEGT